MKYSKEDMDKWLRDKYGVTLNALISGKVDRDTIIDLALDEMEETDAGNEESMPTCILNYMAQFIHP